MAKFEIEKVPLFRSESKTKYPFLDMTPGSDDSFLIPLENRSPTAVAASAHTCARSRGVTITTRLQEEGVRVWRKT